MAEAMTVVDIPIDPPKPENPTDENVSRSDTIPGEVNADAPPTAPVDDLKTQFEALKAENARLAESTTQAQRDSQQSQAYVRQIVERMQAAASEQAPPDPNSVREHLEQDPNAVLDAHFNARIAPLAKMTLEAHANTNFQVFEASNRENEDWMAYKGEVEKFMETIPLEVKAQPNSWQKALDLVRGNHIDEIVERRAKKRTQAEKAAFVEGPSGSIASTSKKIELTPEQKEIAKGLGMSNEDYISYMR